jgi:hypothetical protein
MTSRIEAVGGSTTTIDATPSQSAAGAPARGCLPIWCASRSPRACLQLILEAAALFRGPFSSLKALAN